MFIVYFKSSCELFFFYLQYIIRHNRDSERYNGLE